MRINNKTENFATNFNNINRPNFRPLNLGKINREIDRLGLDTAKKMIANKGVKEFAKKTLEKLGFSAENLKLVKKYIRMRLENLINKLESKKTETKQASSATSNTSSQTHGSGGISNEFLWKPVSDSDGNLVVLLPANISSQIHSVEILSPDGNKVLATGTAKGIANGGRAHFRFNQNGNSFPDGATVKVTMANGETKLIKIPDTGSRYVK